MTAYAASVSAATGSLALTVTPSATYQVRIAKVESSGILVNGGYATVTLRIYPSGTPSGGTTVTPFVMRGGAPAATASAKSGAAVSGSPIVLHIEAASGGDPAANVTYVSLNSSYSFPFDLILSAGSTLQALLTDNTTGLISPTVVVYFEELRLNWSG